MDTNELILRVAEALEKQMAFPQWDTIIQIFSVVAAWITILFLLIERKNKERPYLQVSFELVRSSLACLVIRNVGECPLEVSSIKLSEEFVKQLPQKTQERVASLEKSEVKIFPKRFYVFSLDIITGTIIKDYNIKKLTIDYKYKKLGKYRKKYKEQTTIDFSQYATMLIYISEIDELKGSVDNLLKEVKEIKKLIPSTKIGDTHASKITE
ncbi:hypothetical protein [uncultured Tissierella sp.]|jgi:hypothetical protein|uniref:hypothetical protein n=1 Tax=uncultured Tissierella sp. TaxID=448160 RepID=UPI00280608B2|nr:hypothetical protein [uncultured Tissierella sp.]MDU5083046.1 hypothetical protein [Bacillota bacterium]